MIPFSSATMADLVIRLIGILIALSVHEFAHALAARRLGDPTAEYEGRLTINPVAHLDPIGTLVFLMSTFSGIGGIGWAKPVPVNSSYFRHPKRDTAIVASAGPFSNLILATLAFIAFVLVQRLAPGPADSASMLLLTNILGMSVGINLSLMAFNLLPIAPLDGSKILQLFVPRQYEERYRDFMRMGPFILLFLIFFEPFLPVQIISGWVMWIVDLVLSAFREAAGMM